MADNGRAESTRGLSRGCQFGSYSPLALQLKLIPIEGLLPTNLEVIALMVFW
jgi:hypothetical protein